MMDTQRFSERQADFLKAVTRLDEACQQPFSSFIRDSAIQRFEFCWELAWKVLKLWLEREGLNPATPREVFRAALQAGVIEDGNAWSEAQKNRNLTSHTYDEKLADQVFSYIKTQGLPLFRELAGKVKAWQPD